MDNFSELEESVRFIKSCYPRPISIALLLGSGLGELADILLPQAVKIPYSNIPFFSGSTVEGHQGMLYMGEFRPNVHVAFLKGRVHLYEGYTAQMTIYPIRVMRLLGAETLFVTNSAGGVNPEFRPGELMLIEDHINLMGNNPLIGQNIDELGPRFPDMSEAYSQDLRKLAVEKSDELGIPLRLGVYCAVTGPSYETPAEIRMIRKLGADAVGMSTVPEVIAASHMGMKVLGISCIANHAAGVIKGHRLSHQEVLESSKKAEKYFSQLIQAILADLIS